MYKTFLPVVLFLAVGSMAAIAQPTLTAANFTPSVDEVFASVNCDTNGVTQGPAGPAITWNFSTLAISSYDTSYSIPCSATPHCSTFTGSSYAITTRGTDRFTYYIANATGQSLNGFYASADSDAVYSTPMVQFQYPFTYGTTFSNPYAGTITYGPLTPHETGTLSVTCDGYGTLELPLGITYSDVLRVHTSQLFTDSASLFGIDTIAHFDIETYSWYMANYNTPLMAILTATQVGGSVSTKAVSFSVAQLPPLATPAISGIEPTLQIFPNPVQNEMNIGYNTVNNENVHITLSDMLGREIAVIANRYTQGAQQLSYNTSGLPVGLYLVRFQTSTETITRKVEVE